MIRAPDLGLENLAIFQVSGTKKAIHKGEVIQVNELAPDTLRSGGALPHKFFYGHLDKRQQSPLLAIIQ